jgi:hypothetical protein
MSKKTPKYQDKIRQPWKEIRREDVERKEPQVRLSFEHINPGDHFCLSLCDADDVRHAVDCLLRMTTMTWSQVYGTATKNRAEKKGMHWTTYEDYALKVPRPATIGKDHRISGIRAGEKYRIFGFRFEDCFYVIWFDPNHTVTDG